MTFAIFPKKKERKKKIDILNEDGGVPRHDNSYR